MKLKPITAALAAGTLLGLTTLGAFAQTPPTNPISFDPDGQGGANGATQVQTFDWAVSSLLSIPGVCPENDPGCNTAVTILDLNDPSYLNARTHGALHGFQDAAGNPAGAPAGLNTAFELTFVAGACLRADPVGSIELPLPGGGTITAPRSVTLSLNAIDACVAKAVPLGQLAAPGQFFELWYDDLGDGTGMKSDALTGQGYRDGKLILSGSVIEVAGTDGFTSEERPLFDQYLGDSYGGKLTVIQQGSTSIVVQVNEIDDDFFKSGVDHGSLLPFTGEVRLPYRETNPSQQFYTGASPVTVGTTADLDPDLPAELGALNGASGPHFQQQADASNSFVFIAPPLACRVTGGGNDTAGISTLGGWDGTVAVDAQMSAPIAKGKGKSQILSTALFVYTFGGQAGANTALPPQPKGQWEHQNHDGPNDLEFNFKIGTSAAPKGTKIEAIACTDDGFCKQARPAPNKQIDFVGTGSFTTIKNNTDAAIDGLHTFAGLKDVVPVPKARNGATPTYHWFQVHIEDLGEPGSQKGLTDADDPVQCPPGGSGNNPFADPPIVDNIADCDCQDFYRIRIYAGFVPVLDENDNIVNTGDINKTDVIYEVWGYIDGGNFQIHPLTGFDLK